MRKKSEIKRAIEALRQKCDHISQAKLQVLEGVRSEQWVFDNYVKIPDEERDEEAFFAARDAAQFVAGKIGISAICPELEDDPEDEPDEETVRQGAVSRKEYEKLLARVAWMEGLLRNYDPMAHQSGEPPKDYYNLKEVCERLGLNVRTVGNWVKNGHIIPVYFGQRRFYTEQMITASRSYRVYMEDKHRREAHHEEA